MPRLEKLARIRKLNSPLLLRTVLPCGSGPVTTKCPIGHDGRVRDSRRHDASGLIGRRHRSGSDGTAGCQNAAAGKSAGYSRRRPLAPLADASGVRRGKVCELQWVRVPHLEGGCTPGSSRSRSGGNERSGAFDVKGLPRQLSESAGHNASER